jgi:hypothetical protein
MRLRRIRPMSLIARNHAIMPTEPRATVPSPGTPARSRRQRHAADNKLNNAAGRRGLDRHPGKGRDSCTPSRNLPIFQRPPPSGTT